MHFCFKPITRSEKCWRELACFDYGLGKRAAEYGWYQAEIAGDE
jgi:hypothetical protein